MTTTENKPKLSVVVPVYQEETVIAKFLARVVPILERLTPNFEILFCMDPGKDRTQEVIEEEIRKDPRVRLIIFSRRFGQPASTIAGIESCRGEACVVIDVDLQDPPEVIPDLYKKWQEGYDVVYARRIAREGETIPKRIVSYLAYRLINRMSDVSIPKDTGDFRLINRRVIEALRELKETHGFLRGLVAYVGFDQTEVTYHREARLDGVSKYSQLTGSIKIGINGLITNSTQPLTMILFLSFFGFAFSAGIVIWALARFIFSDSPVAWFAFFSLFVPAFFSSLVLFGLGIVAEYIGRIYDEARMRPKYIISKMIDSQSLASGLKQLKSNVR